MLFGQVAKDTERSRQRFGEKWGAEWSGAEGCGFGTWAVAPGTTRGQHRAGGIDLALDDFSGEDGAWMPRRPALLGRRLVFVVANWTLP